MSMECGVSCPIVEVCQRRVDTFEAQAQRWEGHAVSTDEDTEFWRDIANGGEAPPDGTISLAERRYRSSLEAISGRNSMYKEWYEGYREQFQIQAEAARTALQAVREQCKGYPRIRAKIARFFGRTVCGTTCDEIPTSGDRLTSKDMALELYGQGFYEMGPL